MILPHLILLKVSKIASQQAETSAWLACLLPALDELDKKLRSALAELAVLKKALRKLILISNIIYDSEHY